MSKKLKITVTWLDGRKKVFKEVRNVIDGKSVEWTAEKIKELKNGMLKDYPDAVITVEPMD